MRLGSSRPRSERGPRVALLTPYSGANFGDGAIQDAAIWNIRRRWPGVILAGITLNPSETSRRHGIPAFGIRPDSNHKQASDRSGAGIAPSRVDRIGVDTPSTGKAVASSLFRAAKRTVKSILPRRWTSFLMRIRSEFRHVLASRAFLRGTDLLVISGGGQLDDLWGGPWEHPLALFKWTLLARSRGMRCVFLSVGVGSLDSPISRGLVRMALRSSAFRSYRDVGSRELMARAGFNRDDPVYPDLAFSFPEDEIPRVSLKRVSRRVVGLSPFVYRDPRHWPRKDQKAYEEYLGDLASIVEWLIREDYHVALLGSNLNDASAIDDLVSLLGGRLGAQDLGRITHPGVETCRDYMAQAAAVDLIIASRLHGIILAHLAGTPVIALSYERKIDVYMEDLGQGDYRLALEDFQLSDFQDRFNRLCQDRDQAKSHIDREMARYRDRVGLQFDAIFSPDEAIERMWS